MILVTGGTGMLGSFIVQELQRRGQTVRLLTRTESLLQAQQLGGEIIIGDLGDLESLHRATQGVNGIIHAACTFTSPQIDITAMKSLLESWKEGAFVFISSVSVYGSSLWLPTDETHPLNDTSGYGKGKIRCEALLVDYARSDERTNWTILRPPHIWGPDRRAWKVVRHLHRRIVEGQTVVLPGQSPHEWTRFGDDWVDARELASVAVDCLLHPLGEAANVINSHFTWHDFCTVLIDLCHSPSQIVHKALETITPEELPDKGFFAQPWRYTSGRLEQQHGFQAHYHWQDTIAEMIALDSI